MSGDLAVVFDPIPAPVGAVAGLVTVATDALAADDTFHFALPADDALVVQLVAPDDLARDETLFLERALAIGRAPAVRIERRRSGTLDAATLDRSAMVLFWDVAPPAAGAAASALEAFVREGRGYALYVGPRLGARRQSSLAGTVAVTGIADRRVGGGAILGDIRDEHPLFAPFRAAQGALVAPRFYRYPRLEPAVGADILARFDDGAPAILERALGEGRILLVGLGLDTREGDLPLQPAFLPLMRRLVLHVSGHEATPLWRVTGESWMPSAVRREPVVVAPDGSLERPARGESGGIALTLEQPGVYAAYEGRVDGTPRARVAVNVGPAESELTPADPRELLLGVGESVDSTLRGVTAPTSLEIESRQRGWRLLLVAALLLLAVETIIASRGWRGKARRATIVASERSTG